MGQVSTSARHASDTRSFILRMDGDPTSVRATQQPDPGPYSKFRYIGKDNRDFRFDCMEETGYIDLGPAQRHELPYTRAHRVSSSIYNNNNIGAGVLELMDFRGLRERGKALHRYPSSVCLLFFPAEDTRCHHRGNVLCDRSRAGEGAVMHVLERSLRP